MKATCALVGATLLLLTVPALADLEILEAVDLVPDSNPRGPWDLDVSACPALGRVCVNELTGRLYAPRMDLADVVVADTWTNAPLDRTGDTLTETLSDHTVGQVLPLGSHAAGCAFDAAESPVYLGRPSDGVLVRVLAEGGAAPGPHTLTRDGTDESGGRVASGVYVLALETGAGASRTKLCVLR